MKQKHWLKYFFAKNRTEVMKNAHPSEFLANPERTPNELQTNSKTVPIQARFVVFFQWIFLVPTTNSLGIRSGAHSSWLRSYFWRKNISISVFVSCGQFHLFRYWSRCLTFKRFCWRHVRVPKVHPLLIVTLRPHAGFVNIVTLLYRLVLAFRKILFPWTAWDCKYRVFVLMRYVLIQLLLEKDAWHP